MKRVGRLSVTNFCFCSAGFPLWLWALQAQVRASPLGLCVFPSVAVHSFEDEVSVCDNMAPRNGKYPAETSACPWQIFIFNKTIRPHHTQPVTLGSVDGKKIFARYIIKAKPLKKYRQGFLGHFEPQWDAEPVCCGTEPVPNMLVSSKVRTATANETVLWTAPLDYLGEFVFVATFSISSRKYWFGLESEPVRVVPDCKGCVHPHTRKPGKKGEKKE